jgi:hypothetical protein
MKSIGGASESQKFDAVVRRLLLVSHEEIQKRDKQWDASERRKNGLRFRPLPVPPIPRFS